MKNLIHKMNRIFRIFPCVGDHAYIDSTGVDKKLRSRFTKGENISDQIIFDFKLKKEKSEIPDFLGVGTSEFFINARIANIFNKFVDKSNLALVETEIFGQQFFLLNVLGLRKAIDRNSSIFKAFESGNIEEFEELVFALEAINEYDIFRLKHYRFPIFITEQLKIEIEKLKPTGFFFSDPDNVLSLDF